MTSLRRTTWPSFSSHQYGCGCALMSPRPSGRCSRLSGFPTLLARLDLDVVPQVADTNAVLQRAMTCLAAAREFSIGPATEADGPKTLAFLHQIFEMRYSGHGLSLT